MSEKPLATIAICTRDRPEDLSVSLEAWSGFLAESPWLELLVVANCCSQGTLDAIETMSVKCSMRWVREDTSGLSAARNRAIRESHGEWIVYFDDDAHPDNGYVSALRLILEAAPDEVAGFGGKILPVFECGHPPAWLTKWVRGALSLQDFGDAPRPYRGKEFPYGCNMVFRKEALLRCGGFDDSLIHAEDKYIAEQLKAAGTTLCYEPALVALHRIDRERMTLDALSRSGKRTGYWEAVRLSKLGVGGAGSVLSKRIASALLASLLRGVGRTSQSQGLFVYGKAMHEGFVAGQREIRQGRFD